MGLVSSSPAANDDPQSGPWRIGSWDIGGVDVVLSLFRLMTFEALFDGIRDDRLLRISPRPELKAPATGRSILFRVLLHQCQTLEGTFDVSAVDHRKVM